MSGSDYLPLFAACLAFVSVLLAARGLMGYLGNASAAARLKERISGRPQRRRDSLLAPLAGLGRALTAHFERIGAKVGPRDAAELDRNRLALIQAGLRTRNAPVLFQGVKVFLAVLLGGGFLAARFFGGLELSVLWTCLGAAFLAVLGAYAPEAWLRRKVEARRRRVADELPDALDLLVVCVESGMGLDQAIDRVCTELVLSGPVISSELKLMTLELRAGKARADALRGLSERVGLDDLSSLTSLLVQADVFGISVGRTLRVYSDAMRTKRSQRAEELAAKLPVKLLLPLVGFILPALFVTIMGPAGLTFIEVFAKVNN
ncbi:type II secretion system F family protein [Pseudodesulfovibrio sp.]|uniref:type II secretion system F family protein n=1 Tax=Pseudodesulfovibrio sp. TaxID=2035812 RepID=UPI00263871B8|nr:type II secretion system F family protein [Pseudodesulfovibrio sp.]MDD3311547.1 type II secretion system F family protein [Pseudodesulfovibrio sp.]